MECFEVPALSLDIFPIPVSSVSWNSYSQSSITVLAKNKSKNPVPPFVPHDGFDYDKKMWKDGRSAGY